jgi:hypothetical protein
LKGGSEQEVRENEPAQCGFFHESHDFRAVTRPLSAIDVTIFPSGRFMNLDSLSRYARRVDSSGESTGKMKRKPNTLIKHMFLLSFPKPPGMFTFDLIRQSFNWRPVSIHFPLRTQQ